MAALESAHHFSLGSSLAFPPLFRGIEPNDGHLVDLRDQFMAVSGVKLARNTSLRDVLASFLAHGYTASPSFGLLRFFMQFLLLFVLGLTRYLLGFMLTLGCFA